MAGTACGSGSREPGWAPKNQGFYCYVLDTLGGKRPFAAGAKRFDVTGGSGHSERPGRILGYVRPVRREAETCCECES